MEKRNRYTKEYMIQDLQRAAKNLGRSPTRRDMNKKDGYVPVSTIERAFGSFNNALIVAGLKINQCRTHTKESIILAIQKYEHENHKVPTSEDMRAEDGYPSEQAIRTCFGNFNNALMAAGFDVNNYYNFTKEQVITIILKAYAKLGYVPTMLDMTAKNGFISPSPIIRCFGSYNNALIAAGLLPNYALNRLENSCAICGTTETCGWIHYNDSLICSSCRNKIWKKDHPDYNKMWSLNNPEKQKLMDHKHDAKRRGYTSNPINKKFLSSNGHHLWLNEDKSLVIFIPEFLHKLHYHNHAKPETMERINCIALDYWLNEELYQQLFYGEIYGEETTIYQSA